MARFLIEVDHEAEPLACLHVIRVFLTTGSHFLSRADWGCMDDVHKAWIIVEVDSKEEARRVLPPAFRAGARVIELTKFTLEQVDDLIRQHGGQPGQPPAG
jgi:hypothetical protein